VSTPIPQAAIGAMRAIVIDDGKPDPDRSPEGLRVDLDRVDPLAPFLANRAGKLVVVLPEDLRRAGTS
jgi:hypothetical protein